MLTREEFSKIAAALRTYYPRENLMPNQPAMALWYEQLKDIDYNTLQLAVQKWVATNKWSPSIAELREIVAEFARGKNTLEWGRGWEQVINAISHYGFYREAEALESMDEITREACKRIGFTNICLSENLTADRACFRQIYESLAEREKNTQQLPEGLKMLISQTIEGWKAEGLIEAREGSQNV